MKNPAPNYWLYLALVSIVLNVFLAYQAYGTQPAPMTTLETTTPETLLFVQESDGASIQKNDDETYSLVLNSSPEVLYFADHPYRQAGQMANFELIEMLNAETSNPPNAIILMDTMGEYRNMAVELLEGEVSPDTSTVRYTMRALPVSEGDLYVDLSMLIEDNMEFDAATLFIDAFPTTVDPQMTD